MKTLLLLLVISATRGQYADWRQNLQASIDQLTSDIQNNVQNLQSQIRADIRSSLSEVDRITENAAKEVEQLKQSGVLTTNGQSFIINNGGTSHSVFSGYLPNGEPYFRDTEERVIGDTLYHTDRIYNPKTDKVEASSYTLNLKDPNAKPVPIPTPEASSLQRTIIVNGQAQPPLPLARAQPGAPAQKPSGAPHSPEASA